MGTDRELIGGNETQRSLTITMSASDAQTFMEDWLRDTEAPVLTGGWMERPVTVLSVGPVAGEDELIVRCSDCSAELSPLHVCGLPAERGIRWGVVSDE